MGRYYNFEGASSRVANYIKDLSYNVRRNFVNDEEERVPLSRRGKTQFKLSQNLGKIKQLTCEERLFELPDLPHVAHTESVAIKYIYKKQHNKLDH